jgi:hypothetical protein
MKVIEGDVLSIEKGIAVHFCNIEGIMGSGLAKQVKRKYPSVNIRYVDSQRNPGSFTLCNPRPDFYVCNMITQDLQGKGTRMDWVEQGLKNLNNFLQTSTIYQKHPNDGSFLYFPYSVGCGLGLGSRNYKDCVEEVHLLISEYFAEANLVKWAST